MKRLITILIILSFIPIHCLAAAAPAASLFSIRFNEQLPNSGSARLTVNGIYTDGTDVLIKAGVLWESSDTSIAVVDYDGNVVFTGKGGRVTIKATYEGKSFEATTVAAQKTNSMSYISIAGLPGFCKKNFVYQVSVKAFYSDGSMLDVENKYITYTSDRADIATVDGEGVVKTLGVEGNFTITAVYANKVMTYTAAVVPDSWSLDKVTTSAKLIGVKIFGDFPTEPFQPRKLEVKGDYSDSYYRPLFTAVVWKSSNSNIVSISGDGTISYGGQQGTATITARYDTYEDKVYITVGKSQADYQQEREAALKRAQAQDYKKTFFDAAVVDADRILESLEALNGAGNIPGFSDINSHWAKAEIQLAAKLGIVSGLPDGTFRPDSRITRGEFAILVDRAFAVRHYLEEDSKVFKDVKGKWYRDNVMALKNAGIINGYTDGSFKPDSNIARAEMLAIISRLIVKKDMAIRDSNAKYTDYSNKYWAKKDIDKLYALGALDAFGGSRLEPDRAATKAEAVSIIMKLLQGIDGSVK
jgi:hypothetical protein